MNVKTVKSATVVSSGCNTTERTVAASVRQTEEEAQRPGVAVIGRGASTAASGRWRSVGGGATTGAGGLRPAWPPSSLGFIKGQCNDTRHRRCLFMPHRSLLIFNSSSTDCHDPQINYSIPGSLTFCFHNIPFFFLFFLLFWGFFDHVRLAKMKLEKIPKNGEDGTE